MKKIILLIAICFSTRMASAQKLTFDLITYIAPKTAGAIWKKEVTETITSYTITNAKNNSWCRINLVKSTISKGSLEKDFENEWQDLIVKSYNPSGKPELDEEQEVNGWKIRSGSASFTYDKKDAAVMLTTASGFNRCASIVIVTNSQEYLKDAEKLLASVNLSQPKKDATTASSNNANSNTSLVGTWDIHASEKTGYSSNNYMISGYVNRQYTFHANGTYNFYMKTYQMFIDKMLLNKEQGTYQINGNMLTIIPQKSVIEAWSRQGSNDVWGKKLNTQNVALEKMTYQFNKELISEYSEWKLYLRADKETRRDGYFNNYERNAWVYTITSFKHPVIKLPE